METSWIFITGMLFVFMICYIHSRVAYRDAKKRLETEKAEKRRVKPGYYWYEDDTFSKSKSPNKKVKAIVELIEEGYIYGDLTASDIFPIKELQLSYDDAKKFFESFSYPCKKNEKLVWYDIYKLCQIQKHYDSIYDAFIKISKIPRQVGQRSCTECNTLKENAFIMDFYYKDTYDTPKVNKHYIRPVIAMKC